ncbi:Platinum sensitivity protein [Sporothrix curviconia]|uniref:Platinum sensitivity protein n=1 Tax=Sporothrix curviconia TaxID=1260050 RepID=A0ABP0C761_9PEZI
MRAQSPPEAETLATTTLVDSDLLSLDQDYDILYGRLPSTDGEGQHDTSMMAQAVPHPTQTIDRKRVKVYELRNNDWFDRGTGLCSSTYITTEDGEVREPRIIVESEDAPDRLLLDTRISHEDGFQRQQGMWYPVTTRFLGRDTLIVWTEPTTGLDMALSFQEADGCLLIWNFIHEVQRSIAPQMGEDNMSDEAPVDMSASIALPPAELANLEDIETNMRIMSTTASGRDALSRSIISDNYIHKLIPLVEVAEDLESLMDLHRLCNIIKIILLMNDTAIIEYALSDDCLLGVVGALEYDPDFPSHKANHREWLSKGRFKEVVPIVEEKIRLKIHQTYRLQYLKDVVLARILDDPTFSVLNSLIFFNQVDIVQHIQNNAAFLTDLFSIFSDASETMTRKKQAVFFIQQCCQIIKNLQPPARMSLYGTFLSHGLLNVINFGLRNPDLSVRVSATDVLVSVIDHDPQMIRQTIYRQMHDDSVQLTDTLIDLLHVEVDLGIRSQVCDALKVLLDPVPIQVTVESNANGTDKTPQLTRRLQVDPQQELFFSHFYEHSAVRLFKPLLDLEGRQELHFDVAGESIFNYLNDLTNFFVRAHHHRCKFFMMQHNIAYRFVQLMHCRVKHLQLTAVRFFRQLIATRDEFYTRHIMEKRMIEHIFDLLERCLPRDNLLCSACLDFFDFFVKEDVVELTKHLVMSYKDRIKRLSYLPTFDDLLAGRYPQLVPQHPQHQAILASNGHLASQQQLASSSTDDDLSDGARVPNGVHSSALDSIVMDPDEEAYWNGDDDDDELQNPLGSPDDDQTNGESSVLKQLVDYPSDEEGDEGEGSSDPIEPEREAAESTSTAGGFAGTVNDAHKDSAIMSDDEAEEADEAEDGGAGGAGANSDNGNPSDSENVSPPPSSAQKAASSAALSVGPPPERVSEKRRREEDEDDELSKMMLQNKRRNSRSNSLNANITVLHKMTTGGFNGNGSSNGNSNGNGAEAVGGDTMSTSEGATPAKKISINISSPALQAVATEATGPGQGDDIA